jgi:hypothetical protein
VVIERDETETETETDWPASTCAIRDAITSLLFEIIDGTATGSRERAKAMSAVLQAHERIRAALAPKPTLN